MRFWTFYCSDESAHIQNFASAFIASYCPVIEFGLVGQTMHQIDERTPVSDLEKLTRIYRGVLDRYFA
jgi:acetylornithine deacetylase/succinyl-diaminopimelate desuccinylase-like protein